MTNIDNTVLTSITAQQQQQQSLQVNPCTLPLSTSQWYTGGGIDPSRRHIGQQQLTEDAAINEALMTSPPYLIANGLLSPDVIGLIL